MDNQIYGLTKGQTSPSSAHGFVTKSTPKGSIEPSISPLQLAISSGATFVAQSVSSDIKELTSIIEQGMNHKGFSFINVFSPCVTYNKVNTYDWFKEHLTHVNDIESFDYKDKSKAMNAIMEHDGLVKGLIYHNTEAKSYAEQIDGYLDESLAKRDLQLDSATFDDLIKEYI